MVRPWISPKLKTLVTKSQDKAFVLKFLKKVIRRYGSNKLIVTDGLKAHRVALEI